MQVSILWEPLVKNYNVGIDFAYRTFRWDNGAKGEAHVHCVIIGFSYISLPNKKIYDNGNTYDAANINGYLIDFDDIHIESRRTPLYDVPQIGMGNQPIDDGNYLFSESEMEDFIKIEPLSAKYFKPWYGADEFLKNSPRYCLWLGECSPDELAKMPQCLKRIENVHQYRLQSDRLSTKKLADTPTRFQTENMPKGNYIVIPEVSSEKRRIIPMGYMNDSVLCSNKLRLMPNAELYHFSILQSNIHMAWMRVVCGRLESRYDYSINIVYNNFPWPELTDETKKNLSETAQMIIDAREANKNTSLKNLYVPLLMPVDLKRAHDKNNIAVMKAYGFKTNLTEEDCVVELMKMYKDKISK